MPNLSTIDLEWETHFNRRRGTAQKGEWTVSVVVGETFYCKPRQDDLPLNTYKQVEIAVLREVEVDGEMKAQYWKMEGTPFADIFCEYEKVAAYVPVKVLPKLLEYLESIA